MSICPCAGTEFHSVTPWRAISSAQCDGSLPRAGSGSTTRAPRAVAPNRS
ncbi:hypothetical protein BURPSS13_C0097 [Burkholderia pseudomallei S13]|nr:hypothetical protein BURPSS13_C0097 [Burkholderia pseudomallei S13]